VALLNDSIRGRTLGGEKWELQQTIHKYCPETNTPLWGYTEGSHPSRRQTTAFWGGGVDETVMRALPVPPFTLRKCYRDLIHRVLKEPYKRWTHRNTQLSQSNELADYTWTARTRTPKAPPTSPSKRKRDIYWSTTRLTETRMQHVLRDYLQTEHTNHPQSTPNTGSTQGDRGTQGTEKATAGQIVGVEGISRSSRGVHSDT
jgi:hypothetical protein